MGLVDMSAFGTYWENEMKYPHIADQMSRYHFYIIRSSLHFVSNNLITDEQKEDRVWKLRQWIKALRNKFNVVSSDEFQSINNIVIAFKGR